MILLIVIAVVALLAILLFASGYVSARPNEVLIITGLGKPRSLVGKAGWKVPLLEKTSSINIEQFSVDVNTSEAVPTQDFINVMADAVVKVKVATHDIVEKDDNGNARVLYTKEELLEAAAQNFLNRDTDWIASQIQDVLEGNLREIIGQMELKAMVSDRQAFADKVFRNAQPDLAKMGLEIIAFTVQNFKDNQNAIENLGADNLARIQKDATNAKAKAEAEMATVKAEQAKLAADAQAESDLAIAAKQNEVKIQKAELKAQSSRKEAEADAVGLIEEQNQRKTIESATADANIVKQKKEAEVAEQEAKVAEQRLNATVRNQADADRYAKEQQANADSYTRKQQAEAEKVERQADADAKYYEVTKEADAKAKKAEAELQAAKAEAEGIEAIGNANARAKYAELKAEADGLREKAEAQRLMGEASIIEMIVEQLPKVAEAVASPLSNIDNMTVYGSDGGSKLVGDMMQSINQISEGVGLNIPDLLASTLTGRAMATGMKQADVTKEVTTEKSADVTPEVTTEDAE